MSSKMRSARCATSTTNIRVRGSLPHHLASMPRDRLSHVRFWHLADMLNALTNVRFWEQTGHLTNRCLPISIYEYTA